MHHARLTVRFKQVTCVERVFLPRDRCDLGSWYGIATCGRICLRPRHAGKGWCPSPSLPPSLPRTSPLALRLLCVLWLLSVWLCAVFPFFVRFDRVGWDGVGCRAISCAFDRVFGGHASQEDVFKEVSGFVQSALDGYKVGYRRGSAVYGVVWCGVVTLVLWAPSG